MLGQGEAFALQGPLPAVLLAHQEDRGLAPGFQLDPVLLRTQIHAQNDAGDALVAAQIGVVSLAAEDAGEKDKQRGSEKEADHGKERDYP